METPICDFVKKYTEENGVRFHMPGHKGQGFLGVEQRDITEIEGADVLYQGNGIIAESQRNAAKIFNTAKTLYSTEGSSLSIRAMLYLTSVFAKQQGKIPKIAAGRNAHKVFITACALLDIDVDWLYGDDLLTCKITADCLEKYLSNEGRECVAVYVTSPDYLGNTVKIKELSEVCKKYGVLLLVDNAHGAYLRFLETDRHPIALGADMCCDSAHKTLPVLTGGAYLHFGKSVPACILEQAEDAMQLFSSTSPSYLILQSLDGNNRYLSDSYSKKLQEFIKSIDTLKSDLLKAGFTLVGDEPLKVTIATKSYGYKGDELSDILSKNKIVCEFCDPDYICFMLTLQNGIEAVEVLKKALCDIPKRTEILETAPKVTKAQRCCSPRQALMCDSELKPIEDCEGRVMAAVSVSCPPAIPIVVCGEIIGRNDIERMKYYGIEKIRVKK